jgi:putative nucleotidyltransferase with HDIG domain
VILLVEMCSQFARVELVKDLRKVQPSKWQVTGLPAGAGHEEHRLPRVDGPVNGRVFDHPGPRAGSSGPTPIIQDESDEPNVGWKRRPGLSRLLRATALVVPLVASVVVAAVLSRVLPSGGGWNFLIRLVVMLGVSTLVLFGVNRLTRRLLPLAMLLQMSLTFPDHVPKRFSLALRAGAVKRLTRAVTDAADASDAGGTASEALTRVLILLAALARHDPRTRGHSERVSAYNDLIADELGLSQGDRDKLRWAALLHDIGKLHVETGTLNKPGKLSVAEWRAIHRHPEIGARIVAPLRPWLGDWVDAVGQHHEQFDGQGYPNGLAGTEISLAGRIVAVADAFEVMTALRSYKRPVSARAAREELTRCAGTHFDPRMVRAFLNVSIGRVGYVMGPLSWLAQIPFVGGIPQLENVAATMTRQAISNTGTLSAAGVLAVSGAIAVQPPSAAAALNPSAPSSVSVTNVGQGSAVSKSAVSLAGTQQGASDSLTGKLRSSLDQLGSTPGNSGNAPGNSGSTAGNSGSTPGNSGNAPANSGNAPANSGDAPGNSGNAPGHSGSTPGNSGNAPGHSGSTPGNSGNAPGNSGTAPGNSGNAPGNSGNAPGNSGNAPGNSGNAPGNSGSTPGNSDNAPGNSDNAPGNSGNSGNSPGNSGNSGNSPGNSGNSDSAPGNSGNSDNAPGNSGNAPGHSGSTPGNSGNAPGNSGNAPGNSGNKS